MRRISADYISWRHKILGGKEIATLDDDFVAEAQAEVRLSHIEAEQRANADAIEKLASLIEDDRDEMARIRDRCRQRMFILASERAKAKVLAQFGAAQSEPEQGALKAAE